MPSDVVSDLFVLLVLVQHCGRFAVHHAPCSCIPTGRFSAPERYQSRGSCKTDSLNRGSFFSFGPLILCVLIFGVYPPRLGQSSADLNDMHANVGAFKMATDNVGSQK